MTATSTDPRLAELEFLTELEREGSREVLVRQADRAPIHGLPPLLYRDMVASLLERGLLNGHASMGFGRRYQDVAVEAFMKATVLEALANLFEGQTCRVRINHFGRVHARELRDRLLALHERDAFGPWNRQSWERDLPVRLIAADVDHPLAVILVDIDHFKRVNDERGHAVGDDVIRAICRVVEGVVGGAGELYRYGGDELGVLLPGADVESMKKTAEEIRRQVEAAVAAETKLGWSQTVSVGAVVFCIPVEPRKAFEFADNMLFKAKQTRNRACVAEYPASSGEARVLRL